MKTGVDKIVQMRGGDPEKNKTGVDRIIELLGGDPPAKNQTGVDKIVEILENGGGGGNPNSVQTITGTVDSTFGDVDTLDLFQKIVTGDASAQITIDATAIGIGVLPPAPVGVDQSTLYCCGFDTSYVSTIGQTFLLVWGKNSGDITFAATWPQGGGAGTDLMPYASMVNTTLTIYWHPMPTP